jgi:hypothetical protein
LKSVENLNHQHRGYCLQFVLQLILQYVLYVLETAMSFGSTKPPRNFSLEQDFILEYDGRNWSLICLA